MLTRAKVKENPQKFVSLPQIRIIELVSLFIIVYIAKEIAGFNFSTSLVIVIFLGSTFINLFLTGFEPLILKCQKNNLLSDNFLSWATIFVDFATVMTLVYFTGTVESPFIFVLVVPLFFAGRLLPAMKAGTVVTGATISVMALLAYLEFKGFIPHYSCFPGYEGSKADPNYISGGLLVIGGFMCLMTYLFATFYDNFDIYFKRAEDKLISSQKRIVELARLYDISLGINSVISLDTLLKMVCKEMTLLVRRPWAAVLLVNKKKEITNFVELGELGVVSVKHDGRYNDDKLFLEIIKHNDGFSIENISEERIFKKSQIVAGKNLVPFLSVPVISTKERIGVLLVSDQNPRPFTHEDVRLLTILSGQVATAIEKSRLYEVMNSRIDRIEHENDRLEGANILKTGYISHLSHEFRTPLTSIKAYVESLKDHIDDPDFKEKKDFLEVVSNETDRLIRMVSKVLDVSKIEFGQRQLKRNIFDLKKVVDEVDSSLQPCLQDKKLNLIKMIPDELPMVDGDEDLIKQVFINIIGNAVKYSSAGERIFVEANEDAVSIRVTIRDEGMGIPEDDLKNIFKQFYQVGKGLGDGVGLGLAIVKNIIEQHGGTIQVTSEMGKGSRFTFSLPKEHHFNDLLGFLFGAGEAEEEIKEIFRLTVIVVAEMLSAKIVSLMLIDQERKELYIKNAYGLDEEIVEKSRVKLGRSIAGKVAESGEPLLIENVEELGIAGNANKPQYETKSLISVPLVMGSTIIGVINVNNKTSGKSFSEDDLQLLISLSQRFSKILDRIRTTEDIPAFVEETIVSLRSLQEICSKDKGGLKRKAVSWAIKMARKMMLSEKEIQVIQYVASIHDVGMTTISEDILNKTLELTPKEIDEIRHHPQRGAEILRPLEFVELVSQIMLSHHERIDGKGYPMGLKGDQIPVGAKILSILDAYVSMISTKPFRRQLAIEESIEELIINAGLQFDVKAVSAFIEVLMDEGYIDIEKYTSFSDRLRFGGKHKTIS
ncbi:MAG: GAF domain-containing protein [Candidatus Krumholzibacteriota bacterium]|nr:GAF domain-containing protein [Candidatus Krumholzibacteriota bacterium]